VLGAQRHAAILHVLRTRGAATCAELRRRLSVSEVTVRRDLHALASRGLVIRVHGGAAAVPAAPSPESRAIAEYASTLVHRGMTVGLAAGALSEAIGAALARTADLTVVTNSLPVASALARTGADHTVHLLSGVVTPSGACVGPLAVAAARHFAMDLLFLEPYGLHPGAGLTAADLQEADTDRSMLAAAGRTVVTARRSAWRRIGVGRIAPLSRADLILTSAVPDSVAQQDIGVSVVVVPQPVPRPGR
jgi:DeoR/GlpR family transcriptional regulator of sugar metabolism